MDNDSMMVPVMTGGFDDDGGGVVMMASAVIVEFNPAVVAVMHAVPIVDNDGGTVMMMPVMHPDHHISFGSG
ncbi:hypothetical protein LB543_33225 [Mesorhizobium sp. ESP7-2]|uniref:hypothetical protein n=1 Tax=unclassified Mesorhizobium TaxID=325217 RepID=UPI0015E477B2|nr:MULTISPECIES: hypothetical protein [unclassified Mesorhizobium]MBZ9711547.1 hypothetical protein [Mesorhizobium sp. ESP7-2]